MKAKIITIGDEILIGQIVDTNSAWMATELNKAGIAVDEILSISDDERTIIDTLSESLESHKLTLVTGGLGPTKDDITKRALCKLFDCDMKNDVRSYEHNEKMLTERGIGFTELNKEQSLVPSVCRVLFNRNGTAPGMLFERNGHFLASMPGVPYEMKAIFSEELSPLFAEMTEGGCVMHRTMITTGIAESILAQKIEAWENALPKGIKLAYLPNPNGVRLRLSSYTLPAEQASAYIEHAFASLGELIPEYIIGYEDATVEKVVAAMLTESGRTLSVAESCTGGRISSRFTAMAGASAYYLGGVTSYSNDVKAEVLGVSRDDLEKFGAVSEPVARAMAEGVKRLTGSDYALSTTGIAGPDGGTAEKPVGTVWMAVATPHGTIAEKRVFNAERAVTIERASAFVIDMLRKELLKEKNGSER